MELNINLSPSLVDVNVHPAKTEIKIADEKRIYDIVYGAVSNALIASASNEPKIEKSMPVRENYTENASVSQMKMKIPSFVQKHREEIPTQTVEKFIEYTTTPKEENAFREDVKIEDVFDFIDEKEDEIPYRVIGQAFETYVIFQQGEKVFFIDQHAAHERFRFENLLSDYKAKKKFGQMLLIPVVMNLTASEMDVFRENKGIIEDFGFEAEEFGKDGIINAKDIRYAMYFVEAQNRAFSIRTENCGDKAYLDVIRGILEDRAEKYSNEHYTWRLKENFDIHTLCLMVDSFCTVKQKEAAFLYWGIFTGESLTYAECGRRLGVTGNNIIRCEHAVIRHLLRYKKMLFCWEWNDD